MDISKIRLKDFFSLERYRAVLISLLGKILNYLDGDSKLEIHIIEQYMFRLLQCPQCVSKGSCVHCGCSIPDKMWVKTDYCSDYKWGPFMTKEAWETHKQKYNLKFEIKYDTV